MEHHRQALKARPELKPYTALDRFKSMAADVYGLDPGTLSFEESRKLKEAIHEYDPDVDGAMTEGQ